MKKFEIDGWHRRGDNLFKGYKVVSMSQDVFSCSVVHLKIIGTLTEEDIEQIAVALSKEGYRLLETKVRSKDPDLGLPGFKTNLVMKSKYWHLPNKQFYIHCLSMKIGDFR